MVRGRGGVFLKDLWFRPLGLGLTVYLALGFRPYGLGPGNGSRVGRGISEVFFVRL